MRARWVHMCRSIPQFKCAREVNEACRVSAMFAAMDAAKAELANRKICDGCHGPLTSPGAVHSIHVCERCLSTKDHSGRARGRIWHSTESPATTCTPSQVSQDGRAECGFVGGDRGLSVVDRQHGRDLTHCHRGVGSHKPSATLKWHRFWQ